jgi:hypothetical protein
MRLIAKSGVLAMAGLMLMAVTPARSAPPCPGSALLQHEVIPRDDLGNRDFQSFAHMAWRTFKMLVWPATTSRGEADQTRCMTDTSGPRVFETFKSDWELFPVLSPRQQEWGTYPSEATFCKGYVPPMPGPLPHRSLVLGSLDKFDSVTQPGGIGHVLMAQNGSLVRYLAAFNENAFNLIKNLDPSVDFPASEDDPIAGKTKADDGSITIKSAWVVMKETGPDPNKFYVRSAWVQEPSTGECKEARVGLVGLHIVHKTPSSQQWIWASFEHIGNAPVRNSPARSGFTFNNGGRESMPGTPPPGARIPPKSTLAPYNVERLNEIAAEIQTVNGVWRQALQGSVWSNYQLVLVQWPSLAGISSWPPRLTLFGDHGVKPSPPCNVEPRANMANTVMETFLQSTDRLDCPTDEINLSNTCMGCHYGAHNYDFIWALPLNRGSPDAAVASRNRASALSTLQKITGGSAR